MEQPQPQRDRQTVTLPIVGDGCTDDTAAVVHSFQDERLIWLDWPKAPGVGYANRNRALRQARGDLIAYLAHDDLWFPDHLAQVAGNLLDSGAELAYSLPLAVSLSSHIEPMVFNLNDPGTWQAWREQNLGYLSITGVVPTRACLARSGEWNETLTAGGDWDLWRRLARREPAPNFAYCPVPTTLHFVADWRRRHQTRPRAWWRRLRAWENRYPPALKLDLGWDATEQAAAWRAMQPDPAAWAREVRRAIQVELDRRGAYQLTLSDLLESARRYYRRWRAPRRAGPQGAPPTRR